MRHELKYDEEGWLKLYDGHTVVRVDSLPKSNGETMACINLKGANGSVKSSIPTAILTSEGGWRYLTASAGEKKPCGVYVPTARLAIIGLYSEGIACGGCDALGNTQIVKQVLARLWKRDVHILFEGVIVGDIRSTFYSLMLAFSKVHKRNVSFCFMGTSLSVCLGRIQKRNGGKPINEGLVRQKYQNSITQLKWYLDQGDVECKVLSTLGTKADVFIRFLEMYPELT